MLPPEPPKHKDDLRKKALSSILANSPQAVSPLVQQQKKAEEEVVQDAEDEEEEGDTFPVESDLNFPQRQSKVLVPKLATWEQYWDHRLDLWLPERKGRFSVYMAGSSGPVVFCCHGGGYTGLSWSLVARQLKDKYRVVAPDLRGHGLTATDNDKDMSKETFAADIVAIWRHLFGESSSSNSSSAQGDKQQQIEPQQQHQHQEPQHQQPQQQQQQQEQTAPAQSASQQPSPPSHPPSETTTLVHGPGTSAPAGTLPLHQQSTSSPSQSLPAAASSAPASSPPPPTLLVGHSMGGAAATWAASTREIKNLAGLIVVDVVEGTALAALPSMIGILCRRPKHFASQEAAVTWALKSGMCKSREAAAISVPAQIRFQPQQQQQQGDPQQMTQPQQQQQQQQGEQDGQHQEQGKQGHEQNHEQQQQNPQQHTQSQQQQQQQQQQGPGTWVWRTDLAATQPFWHGWYSGLSDAFLKVPGPKMLMLAGTDRLDKPLTIGQMQGKFQLVLLPMAGHAVHEDEAMAAANHIRTFLQRFRVGEPPLVVPRPFSGLQPVLPIVAGPIHKP